MIGIIGAMDIEVKGIVAFLENTKEIHIGHLCFYTGTYKGKEVVCCVSGIGKVNSAICTQTMILNFKPECIINTGVAGCLSENLDILDVAISKSVAEHDFDLSPLGEEKGFVPGVDCVYMEASGKLVATLESASNSLKYKYETGVIASGDCFVADNSTRSRIKNEFNAIANEMEGASIGHVCFINNVPFCVIRVMSDNANNSSDMDYEDFKVLAADKSIEIIKEFLNTY